MEGVGETLKRKQWILIEELIKNEAPFFVAV